MDEPNGPSILGRPRSNEVTERINHAALKLLRERGPGGVTIEAVAEVSGAAKTTIYRRFNDRSELLAAALSMVGDVPEFTMPDDTRMSIVMLLRFFEENLVNVVGTRAVAAVLGNDRDPDFSAAFRESVLGPRVHVFRQTLARGVERGDLRPDIDADVVVALLAGSYFSQLIINGVVPPGWPERTILALWPAIAGDTPSAAAPWR